MAETTVAAVAVKANDFGNAKVVTAKTFDPRRVIFKAFHSEPIKNPGTPGAGNYDHLPIAYAFGNPGGDPDPEDEGNTFKWASPLLVSPQGFTTRAQAGKGDEWSFMATFGPDDKPDWDDDTMKRMASDAEFKALMEKRHQDKVAAHKAELEEEVAALNLLSDTIVKHLETLKKNPKAHMKIKGCSIETFGRTPYAKPEDIAKGTPRYTAWFKLLDMVYEGKTIRANVVLADGTPIPKFAPKPKPGEEPDLSWSDLKDRRLVIETCWTIRGIFFGNVNKIQTSANSVIVHSVGPAEVSDPLLAKTAEYAADDEKAQAAKRNKEKMRQLRGTTTSSSSSSVPEDPYAESSAPRGTNMAEGTTEPSTEFQPRAQPTQAAAAQPSKALALVPAGGRGAPPVRANKGAVPPAIKRQPAKKAAPAPEPEPEPEPEPAPDEQASQ